MSGLYIFKVLEGFGVLISREFVHIGLKIYKLCFHSLVEPTAGQSGPWPPLLCANISLRPHLADRGAKPWALDSQQGNPCAI
jgi:hypothetical protein